MKNIFTFEISLLADVVHAAENLAVFFAEEPIDFISRPDKKLSFFAFAVGILSRVKAAFRMQHFAQQIVAKFLHHRFEKWLPVILYACA